MDTPPPSPITIPTSSSSDDESKKKYIRTYAGDMEIVKKGGTPDLKPLEPTAPTPPVEVPTPAPVPPPPPIKVAPPPPPKPKPVPPPPPPPPPKPIPPPPPPPPKPVPPPVPKPVPPPPPPPPPRPIPPPPPPIPKPAPIIRPEPKVFPLKTYSDDFLQKVKDTHASTATVLAAEEDAGAAPKVVSQGPRRWSILTIVVGVVLVLFGGAGVYVGYTHYLITTAPITLAPTVSAPIFVDEKVKIPGATGAALLQEIITSISNPPAPNTVRLLYTDAATTTDNSIFSALQLPAPGVLLRNIDASQSMAGVLHIGSTVSPFFILSVASYPDTFAGMLSWEAILPSDVSALFPPYQSAVSTTTATTTPTTSKKGAKVTPVAPPAPTPPAAFYDQVVNNHDVRIYQDAQGRSVLLYGYWNQNTLIIARDPAAFTEILRRLATSNTQ